MIKPVIICDACKYRHFHLFAGHTIVKGFLTIISKPKILQRSPYLFLFAFEHSAIYSLCRKSTDLSCNYLKQLTHCHTRRYSMRINNYIRHDAVRRKRHILFRNHKTYDTFLPVSCCHLVTNFRSLCVTHDSRHNLIAFSIRCKYNFLHNARITACDSKRIVTEVLKTHLNLFRYA